MTSDYLVLWDGTDRAPLGRLLFPPTTPEPVKPRILPPTSEAVVTERMREQREGGAVSQAKDRLWAYLAEPRTVLDISESLSLPRSSVYLAMDRACRAGYVVRDGKMFNARRMRGVPMWSWRYVRAARYAASETWPDRVSVLTERAS